MNDLAEPISTDPDAKLTATLQQVLDLPAMRASPVLAGLLRFLAGAMAPERVGRLTARQIAREALGQPEGFDAQANSLVRVHMARLRQILDEQRATLGSTVPWHLHVPKGQYCLRLIPSRAEGSNVANATLPSLAVMRIKNVTNEPHRAHFCDGMTLELLHLLSQSPAVRVVVPHTMFPLPVKMGRVVRPAAEYLLTCSLEFQADDESPAGKGRFTLIASLDDVTQQRVVWTKSYERPFTITQLRKALEEITVQTWTLVGAPGLPIDTPPKGRLRWKFPDGYGPV
jgi:TolB-like protein